MKIRGSIAVLAALGLSQSCEPASVMEAREILGRNPGIASFQLPLADTTYLITDLLGSAVDTLTTAGGLLGVRVQADTLSALNYANQLVTSEVTTSVGFPSPGFSAPGDNRDTVRFTTTGNSDVVSATIQTGYVVRTITNNTGCAATADGDVLDSLGNTVVAFPTANVADGVTYVDSVPADGATMVGFVDIGATGAPVGACVPNPGGRVNTAVIVRALALSSVTLDNVSEAITVEQGVSLDRAQLNLDDFEDAVLDATLNDATIDLVVANTADIPVVLSNFFIVAVQTDGAGNLMRDGGGNLIFETDGTGARLEAAIADSNMTTLTIGRQATTNVMVQAAPVVDRMVDLLIQNQNVALVAIADAVAGDGSRATMTSADDVEVQFDMVIGMDFTVPIQGVRIERNQSTSGLGLDPDDADDIADVVVRAGITGEVINSIPFGLAIQLALAPGVLADGVDVFAQPGAVVLAADTVAGAPTNAQGVPIGGPAIDTLNVTITGSNSRVLLEGDFTAGIRMVLLPGTTGRGAFLPTAGVSINASVLLEIQQGTPGGGS